MNRRMNSGRAAFGRTLALILLILLTGCQGSDYRSTDLLALMMESSGRQGGVQIYFEGGEEANRLEQSERKLLYNGMDPVELSDDYAVCLSLSDRFFEIHVYRPASTGRAAEVEKILRRRLDLLQSKEVYLYSGEDYESVISVGRIERRGGFVILLLTPDNDAVLADLRKAI